MSKQMKTKTVKTVPYKQMSPADQAELDHLARITEPPPTPPK